jgi:hypothetical protein
MQLTTKGRFAVTAMMDIALHGSQEPVTLARICERQKISLYCKIKEGATNRSSSNTKTRLVWQGKEYMNRSICWFNKNIVRNTF